MPINSKTKGKVGEREWVHFLEEHGFRAKRTAQNAGAAVTNSYDDLCSDVVSKDLPDFHMEVKRVEALNIYRAMEQAIRDAGELWPMVAHRKNGKYWLVTMRADHFLTIIKTQKG